MQDVCRRVVDLIRCAFRGVTLGNGVGLLQGQAFDDYTDAETAAEHRRKDEKEDWSRIPAEALNSCQSSLSFFDAEGMRFHLPAYLIAELDGTLTQNIVFHLTYTGDGATDRFDLLSEEQRHAVREFLLLLLSDDGEFDPLWIDFNRPMIEAALAGYWKNP